jgi:RNA polymerase sigma factor (sigma-70 family)
MAIGGARRQLERLFGGGTVAGLTEGQLLDRFLSRRDDAAFEALVARHGPMVVAVCRRLLRDPNDVDDAFQATFLVLVRKAGTLRRRDLLGNWLYGVAFRVASRARAVSARRLVAERSTEEVADLAQAPAADTPDPALHEEVHRLPEKYRAPVVLCYLEGLTHEEAADRLRWPVGTVKGRLARARDLLRSRLTRRGVTLASAVGALELLARDAKAALPGRLVTFTVKAATHAAAGTSLVGLISTQALSLSEGVIHAMSLSQLKMFAVTAAVAGTLVGGGAYAYQGTATKAGGPKGKTRAAAVDSGRPTGPTEAMRKAMTKAQAEADTQKTIQEEADTPKPLGLPDSVRSSVQSLRDEALRAVREYTEKGFSAYLDQVTNAITPEQLDQIARFSRSSRDEEVQFLSQRDERQKAAQQHVNRMLRLQEAATKLTGPDKGAKIVNASQLVIAAQAEVNNVVWAGPGISYRGMGSMGMNPPITPVLPPTPTTSEPGPAPISLSPAPVTVVNTRSGPKVVSPAGGGGGVASPTATSAGQSMTGGGGMGGGVGVSAVETRRRESDYRVAISEIAPKLAEKDGSPKTKAILAKLDELVAMNFPNETPLEDVLKFIKSATQKGNEPGLPIYIDPVGLQDAEKTLASTVALDLEGVPLKTALRLALKQLGLAYCVKDGLLIISSPEGIVQELMESPGFVGTTDAQKVQMMLPGGRGGMM